jgi:hypothetical protein
MYFFFIYSFLICFSFTEESDVYSLGCVGYYLMMKTPPFISKDHIKLILDGQYKEIPKGKYYSDQFIECIKAMMNKVCFSFFIIIIIKDSKKRPKVDFLLNLPMFSEQIPSIKQLPSYDISMDNEQIVTNRKYPPLPTKIANNLDNPQIFRPVPSILEIGNTNYYNQQGFQQKKNIFPPLPTITSPLDNTRYNQRSELKEINFEMCPFCNEKYKGKEEIIDVCKYGHIICFKCFEEKLKESIRKGEIKISCFGDNNCNNKCSYIYEDNFFENYITIPIMNLYKKNKKEKEEENVVKRSSLIKQVRQDENDQENLRKDECSLDSFLILIFF